jgi:hypothetical protein
MTCNGVGLATKWGLQRQKVYAMTCSRPNVDTPDSFITFKHDLPHFFKALHGGAPLRIVAMGSSSTAGSGDDVVPYPARLEMYQRWQYREKFPLQRKLGRRIGADDGADCR